MALYNKGVFDMNTGNHSVAFSYLDQMGTPELEAIIRVDADSVQKHDEEVILHILKTLNERARRGQSL